MKLKNGKTNNGLLIRLLNILALDDEKTDFYTEVLEDGHDFQVIVSNKESINIYKYKGYVDLWYYRDPEKEDLVQIPLEKRGIK